MSILIKGMEMPKNCTECRFAVDGWCYGLTPTEPNSKSLATGTRPSWCPLIEVPKHGRLIDASVLDKMTMWDTNREYDKGWNSAVRMAQERIADAPTIIEAEGEE